MVVELSVALGQSVVIAWTVTLVLQSVVVDQSVAFGQCKGIG